MRTPKIIKKFLMYLAFYDERKAYEEHLKKCKPRTQDDDLEDINIMRELSSLWYRDM
jgi:hypothetical protein